MTKAQFIEAVEAKPNFKAWAQEPRMVEKLGDIEKWTGVAHTVTPDGANLFNVWFIWDSAADEAAWQNGDTLEPEKNTDAAKLNALSSYLKANFSAHFIGRVDLANNWAEADVYTPSNGKLQKKSVIVYKKGSNPIAHLDVL